MKHLSGHLWRTGHNLQIRELLLLICAPKIHRKSLPHGAWPGPPRISGKQSFRWDFVQSLHLECFQWLTLGLCEFLCTLISHIFDILLTHVISASHIKKSSGTLFPPLRWQNKHFHKHHKNKYCHMFYLLISQTK